MSQSNYRLAITICSLPLSTKCVYLFVKYQYIHTTLKCIWIKGIYGIVKKHFNSLTVSLSLGSEGTSICFYIKCLIKYHWMFKSVS